MKDDGRTIVISTAGARGCAVAAFAMGLLVGLALVALFVASVLAPNEGAGPAWTLLVVGVLWTLLCALGVATTSFVEIDSTRREVRQVISHLGLRRTTVTAFEEIVEVGIRRDPYERAGGHPPFRIHLRVRALVPGTTLSRAIHLHAPPDANRLGVDAHIVAERIGVPFARA